MTRRSIVRRVDARTLDIPLRKPFGIAGGTHDLARNVLLTIELDDGTLGYGEAAPLPAFNGETQSDALRAIEAARAVVVGADPRDIEALSKPIREATQGTGSARCAIETALVDAVARQDGIPLHRRFGGAETVLETDVTLSLGTEAEAAREAKAFTDLGFRVLKVKVGSGDINLDIERLRAAHAAAPHARLLLDGNAGFTLDGALALTNALADLGIAIDLFEQPTRGDDLDALAEVATRSGIPVAADESVASPDDALRVARHGGIAAVNVKLMKCGVVDALAIARIARAAGQDLMIGGMVESMLAMSVSACFAAGLGGFRFVDLDTPLFLAENPFEGGYVERGPVLDLTSIESGHGVRPRADR